MRDLTDDYRFQRILIEAAQFRTLRAAYRADPTGPVTTALLQETFSTQRDDPAILRKDCQGINPGKAWHTKAPSGAFSFANFQHETISIVARNLCRASRLCRSQTLQDVSECTQWCRPGDRVGRSRYDWFGKHELAPRPCQKARKLNSDIKAAVPHWAAACVHFEANPSPPPVWAPHARKG